MDNSLYSLEYNGRHTILNRVYHPESGRYQFAPEIWDISAYEKEFNATPDESIKNMF